MQGLDPRLITVAVEVNGGFKTYNQGLAITAKGTKYASALMNDCEVTISNLDKATQDYILTETSPYNLNRTPKLINIDAGRTSYGLSRIFSGNIYTSKPSQPPDIAVILTCLTRGFDQGNVISRNQPGQVALSKIAQQVANDLNLTLTFEADDRQITNYNYSGSALNQITELGKFGPIDAYQDDQRLIIKNKNKPLSSKTRIVNLNTGMIGIPELTEQGIKVKFLLNNQTVVGGALQVTSNVYPAANGNYIIYKLSFDIASRDTPFYYIAEAARVL